LRIARNFWDSILRSVTVNRASKACINGLDEHIDSPQELVGARLESLEEWKRPTSRLKASSSTGSKKETLQISGRPSIKSCQDLLVISSFLERERRFDLEMEA